MTSEPETVHTPTPDPSRQLAVFNQLKAGNERYRNGLMRHPHTGFDDMVKLAPGQAPKVCVLACADSRVPPEVIFDQGLGDMFVVRVAGNFADDDNQASLEYAVQHFDPPPAIIVVLGHERCGAIQAAAITFDPDSVLPEHVEKFNHHPEPSEKLVSLVTQLQNAIESTRGKRNTEEYALRLEDAVRQNVEDNVATLQANEVITEFGTFVIGGRYDLDDGGVEWLTATPNQTMLDSSGPTAGAKFFSHTDGGTELVCIQTDDKKVFAINPKGGAVLIGEGFDLFPSDEEGFEATSVQLYLEGAVQAGHYFGCGDELTVAGTSLNTELVTLKETIKALEQRLLALENQK